MGIFDSYVEEICRAPMYLTPDQQTELRKAILSEDELVILESAADPDEDTEQGLGDILKRLQKMANRLYMKAESSKDSSDMKAAAESLRRLLDLSLKHAEKVSAADRAQQVENILIEVMLKFCDERDLEDLKQEFLEELKERIDG